jgi:hypothetical protein
MCSTVTTVHAITRKQSIVLYQVSVQLQVKVNVRDHLQIIRSKSETKRNCFSVLLQLQNPFHNLKRFIRYRNVSLCKRISVTKIRFSLKLQKSVTNLLQNHSVRKAFHFTNVTDSFHIHYGWICELGNIGMVCTVFKYVSLQKRYPKLLIKLGTDFEVGQKRKTLSNE